MLQHVAACCSRHKMPHAPTSFASRPHPSPVLLQARDGWLPPFRNPSALSLRTQGRDLSRSPPTTSPTQSPAAQKGCALRPSHGGECRRESRRRKQTSKNDPEAKAEAVTWRRKLMSLMWSRLRSSIKPLVWSAYHANTCNGNPSVSRSSSNTYISSNISSKCCSKQTKV